MLCTQSPPWTIVYSEACLTTQSCYNVAVSCTTIGKSRSLVTYFRGHRSSECTVHALLSGSLLWNSRTVSPLQFLLDWDDSLSCSCDEMLARRSLILACMPMSCRDAWMIHILQVLTCSHNPTISMRIWYTWSRSFCSYFLKEQMAFD